MGLAVNFTYKEVISILYDDEIEGDRTFLIVFIWAASFKTKKDIKSELQTHIFQKHMCKSL